MSARSGNNDRDIAPDNSALLWIDRHWFPKPTRREPPNVVPHKAGLCWAAGANGLRRSCRINGRISFLQGANNGCTPPSVAASRGNAVLNDATPLELSRGRDMRVASRLRPNAKRRSQTGATGGRAVAAVCDVCDRRRHPRNSFRHSQAPLQSLHAAAVALAQTQTSRPAFRQPSALLRHRLHWRPQINSQQRQSPRRFPKVLSDRTGMWCVCRQIRFDARPLAFVRGIWRETRVGAHRAAQSSLADWRYKW